MVLESGNHESAEMAPATFVLLHGAWHGGWCYRDTARVLREAGHTVYTPTLTGLGERAHLNSHAITLETHIRDVCGVLEAEELHNVILVGHSYGGMVITGVADRMSDRIQSLVYLDAFVPEHGQSFNDCIRLAFSEENAAAYLSAFRADAMTGNGGLTLPVPAAAFNVEPKNRAWIDRRCSPQAFATFETQVLLTGRGAAIKDRLYILAEGWGPSPFPYYAKQVTGKAGWRVSRLPCSHDVMIDMPVELANLLMTLTPITRDTTAAESLR
ncbi:Alpha/beta hydrolase family protein [Paraburkholderia fungorum]|uniref:Alpha/beta hydrolase family protein n=1 Tax=Paraburkholderia fungorum TaxID=134537 RepID=A0A1H1H760_9BURK|nr:alpha/beta hydrolase [Paraburkholderia fungorum]SDR20928.1 Alpha/beta hydrolase family protein [Paraburkholderia fungorum]